MKANFDRCMTEVFKHEGGYVNHPSDPGGETNMGISKRSYPKEDIRGMTRERASQIYRRDFWAKIKGDDLPAGLDMVAFDAAVNSGPSRGAKWLQQALGVPADGKIGPVTINAARQQYAPAAIQRAIGFRMAFLKGLPTWSKFGKGWAKRLQAVEAAALDMAGTDIPVRPDVEPLPPKSAAGWWVQLLTLIAALFHKSRRN